MLRRSVLLALAAALVTLGLAPRAHSWGVRHYGYTHYSPYTGLHHYGYTRAYGGYGGGDRYRYGGYHYGGYGYGGYHYGGYGSGTSGAYGYYRRW